MKRLLMMKTLLLGILSLFVLVGCQNAQPNAQTAVIEDIKVTAGPVIAQPTAHVFKTSDAGFITVSGQLLVLDPTLMLPAPDDAVYLVPMPEGEGATSIPPFKEGEVPQAEVDEYTGKFVFTNVTPGQYAVVVRTMGGSQIPTRQHANGNLAIFTFEEKDIDTTVEVKNLSLP